MRLNTKEQQLSTHIRSRQPQAKEERELAAGNLIKRSRRQKQFDRSEKICCHECSRMLN